MLYFAIPSFDEAETIGLLLWRVRTVMATQGTEYEILVYDDGSRDATREVLTPYAKVLPLTVLHGSARRGTGAALDQLAREAARRTRYPRRDAVVFLQGDLTDRPEDLPELLRRFAGGADLVVGERTVTGAPMGVQRVRTAERWLVRRLVRVDGLSDFTSAMRVVRLSAVRDAVAERRDRPLAHGEGPVAQLDLLLALLPHARRVDAVPVTPNFALRSRGSRLKGWPDAIALVKYAWAKRGTRSATVQRAEIRKATTLEDGEPEELSAPRLRMLEEDDIEHAPTARAGRAAERDRRGDGDRDASRRDRSGRRGDRGRERPRERPTRETPRPVREPVHGATALGTGEAEDPTGAAPADAAPERARRKRRKRRGERASAGAADGAPVVGESNPPGTTDDDGDGRATAPSIGGPAADGDGEIRARKRRGRRRKSPRSPSGAQASDGDALSGDDGGADAGEPRDVEGGATDAESATERLERRRRRTRKRRRGGSGRAAATGDASAGEGADGADSRERHDSGESDAGATDRSRGGDDAGDAGDEADRRRRRARRRRRRGPRRDGVAPAEGADGGGADSAPPAPPPE
ncbi:MAG: glycosyltransferase family 2 protein [Gemmatimonadaceae bacterium]|nr:glycosyltransferase family 2 protein [Gemmatimonadaceae bacterium]